MLAVILALAVGLWALGPDVLRVLTGREPRFHEPERRRSDRWHT